jgi:predicted dehydrogenase
MIRIGIVGTGIVAHEHAKSIAQLHGIAALVAAADVAPERLRAFCDAFSVPCAYADASALIASPNVDLVAITTPPSAHEDVALAALTAGKHVLCEKPLAHSMASAKAIADAEKRYPGRVAVGYQLRYQPQYRRLAWLARNGWLGTIESVLIERHSQMPPADPGKAGWWGSWQISGGGVLITQMIHELDLLVCAAGMPKSVSARMDTRYTQIESEDHAELTMRLASGGSARCIASVNSPRRGGGVSIKATHAEVSLPWQFNARNPEDVARALAALNRALPETWGPSSSLAARGARFAKRRLGMRAPAELSPHALFYRDIAMAMAAGKPLPIPPAEAMKSLELVAAAYESALSGKEVELPLGASAKAAQGVTVADWIVRRCPRFEPRPLPPPLPKRPSPAGVIRVGYVGVDTSHAPTFASILHDPSNMFHIPGARVVAAFPGGSPDMEISASRVGGFTAELRDRHRVQIVDSPEEAADLCDVVLMLSSDGRLHPALFRAIAGRGKPVFIDKPFAISTSDADEICRIARETNTRFFASSVYRYADGLVAAINSIRDAGEQVKSVRIRSWLPIQPTQGRYFWYGIHAAEMLLACIGPGVTEVRVTGNAREDSIVVRHRSGVDATIVGSQTDGTFAVELETDRRKIAIPIEASAASMPSRVLWSALDVLVNGSFPKLWSASSVGSVGGARPSRGVDPSIEETVEIVHLLDAAQKSYASKAPAVVHPTSDYASQEQAA